MSAYQAVIAVKSPSQPPTWVQPLDWAYAPTVRAANRSSSAGQNTAMITPVVRVVTEEHVRREDRPGEQVDAEALGDVVLRRVRRQVVDQYQYESQNEP